ncbi:hypothetical protein TNCV_1147021 [Trichonephila clavipes]|nr:hypothetical protein TNCV_1147021 [Trichonephila clavipes]
MPVVTLSFEHHTGDSTIWLAFSSILMENFLLGASGVSNLSSPSTNLTKGLAARRLFRVSPRCEDTKHLQTSIPSPGFKPRPYGTAVNLANHYTGWATAVKYKINKLKTYLQFI